MVNSTSSSPHLDLRQLSDAQLHALADRIEADNPWSGLRYHILCTPRRFLVTFWVIVIVQIAFENMLLTAVAGLLALLYDIKVTANTPDARLSPRDVLFHFKQNWESNGERDKFANKAKTHSWLLLIPVYGAISTYLILQSINGELAISDATMMITLQHIPSAMLMSKYLLEKTGTKPTCATYRTFDFSKFFSTKTLLSYIFFISFHILVFTFIATWPETLYIQHSGTIISNDYSVLKDIFIEITAPNYGLIMTNWLVLLAAGSKYTIIAHYLYTPRINLDEEKQ